MNNNHKDIEQLKYWLDSEITIIHIGFYTTWGILIGGKFWYIVAFCVALSLMYAAKRSRKIPRHYLSVKEQA